MSKQITGSFTSSTQSAVAQGTKGLICASGGSGTVGLQIQVNGTWFDEGTTVSPGEMKAFDITTSLPARLDCTYTSGTIVYALVVE